MMGMEIYIMTRHRDTTGMKQLCSGGITGEELTCQCGRCQRRGFSPWLGKSPWSSNWQPPPLILPGKPHGQWNLGGYSHGVSESQT